MSTWTVERARLASLSRSRASDDPELIDARRNLKAERLADYIQRTVDAAPPLTAEQRLRLAGILTAGVSCMGLPDNDRSRPAANGTASKLSNGDMASVPRSSDMLRDLDALAASLRGYLVVQVVVDDEGHRRTHLYRSAGAAQRAVQRAKDRGRAAHVSARQLLPVAVVQGLEVAS